MGLIAAACPKCGGALDILEGIDEFYCKYCGTKIIQDIDRLEVLGEVAVKGVADEDSLLERAFIFIEDGNFQRALKYIERVLDIVPTYAKAYIAMFMCQVGVCKSKNLYKLNINPNTYSSYKKAIRFSAGKEREKYIEISRKIANAAQLRKSKLIIEMETLQSEIHKSNNFYNAQYEISRNNTKWTVILILSIVNFLFWLSGAFFNLFFLFFSIPSLAFMIWTIIKYPNIKSNSNALAQSKANIRKYSILLQEKQAEFNRII